MKDRNDMIVALRSALMEAGDSLIVTIAREEAEWLLNHLTASNRTSCTEGRGQLFYCAHCGKSFQREGREDEEIKEKYGYSVWYASCPTCGEEVRLTDHYWR